MQEKIRGKLLKKMYEEEILTPIYEEYIDSSNIRRIKTALIVGGEFQKIFKLDEYGVWQEQKITYLESIGYKNKYSEEIKKILKR